MTVANPALRSKCVDVIVVDHHTAKEAHVSCILVNPRVNDAPEAAWQSLCLVSFDLRKLGTDSRPPKDPEAVARIKEQWAAGV